MADTNVTKYRKGLFAKPLSKDLVKVLFAGVIPCTPTLGVNDFPGCNCTKDGFTEAYFNPRDVDVLIPYSPGLTGMTALDMRCFRDYLRLLYDQFGTARNRSVCIEA